MERVDCGHDDEETGGSNTTSHGPDVCSMGRTQIANEAETERELQEMEEPTSRQEQETASRLPQHLIRYLYTGHFLARWGVRFPSKLPLFCFVFEITATVTVIFWEK